KEHLFPSHCPVNARLQMGNFMGENIQLMNQIRDDSKYDCLLGVEKVNRQVLEGIPFRDAYKNTGLAIEAGNFSPDKSLNHVHEGSIGNLCNAEIQEEFEKVFQAFDFQSVKETLSRLLAS